MKKTISAAFCAGLCLLAFAGCSGTVEEKIVERETAVQVSSTVQTDEKSIAGAYGNEYYSMTVTQDDDGLFTFEISSVLKDNTFYEWKMTGFVGDGHINYSDAEKQIITCDKNGKEKSREIEYSMGGGRMEFEDDGIIVWKDSMESIPGSNRFAKQNKKTG